MADKRKDFSFRENIHVTKICKKTTYPEKFVNKIWLKVGKHKYSYIFEIEFGKKLFKNSQQNNFCHIVQ